MKRPGALFFSTVFLILLTCGTLHAAQPLATFKLEDFIKRDWHNERVVYPVDEKLWNRKDVSLQTADGHPVPCQWVEADQSSNGKKSIAFQANVSPLSEAEYRLVEGAPAAEPSLRANESAGVLELGNGVIAVRLNTGERALKDGPIAGIRLASGKWVGGGELKMLQPPSSCDVSVTANGPVFVDATAIYHFGEKAEWRLKFRVLRNEPVVLVDENFDLPMPGGVYRFAPARSWPVTELFYRRCNQINLFKGGQIIANANTGRQEIWKIGAAEDKNPPFVLEPWLHWQVRDRQGTWFAMMDESGGDMLAIAAAHPGTWVDPKRYWLRMPQSTAAVYFTLENGELTGDFPLLWGTRSWMLMVVDKEKSLADYKAFPAWTTSEPARYNCPLPQQYLIKYSDFPLDMVKDYTLTWKGDHDAYPRLLVKKDDLVAWRKTIDVEAIRKQVPDLLNQRVSTEATEPWIIPYLATGDASLGKYLSGAAADMIQQSVDMYVKQQYQATLGFAPHHQQIVSVALMLADAVMGGGQMPPDVKRRVLAQAAFLGYTLDRPDYWSPERGFAANANMTTSAYGYKATVGCFIPSHPKARGWADNAIREMKAQLRGWSDDNGGWLEAPHYAMVSYDQILGVLLMAHNAGFDDGLYDPKVKQVINWFSKISTPPDSRFKGFRHLPPIGNTYMVEPTGEFGLVARLWRDKDPAFARQMQWMYHQQRSWLQPGIGGGYPAFAGYRSILLDPTIPEEPPVWSSEFFPKTGVVLRDKYPSARETMLYMIAGSHHDHYDNDSGAITFWGKGRILCEDFGYYGCAPGEDHSMVIAPSAPESEIMRVLKFAPDSSADYVLGEKAGWRRQVLFVKDDADKASSYTVLCDALVAPHPSAKWRLWTTSNTIDLSENRATVNGKEDVDMDVFFASSKPVQLSEAPKTCTSGAGLNPDGQQITFPSTQNGVIASMANQPVVTALLYPRLKTEKPPSVTTLADGRAFRIQSPAGEDWVFISDAPFAFTQDDISFEGTVGFLRIRDGKPAFVLPSPGRIAARGKSLDTGKPVQAKKNMIDNGDFESGVNDVVPPRLPEVQANIFPGDPVPNGSGHEGKYCLAIKQDRSCTCWTVKPLFIDPAQTYRLQANLYSPDVASTYVECLAYGNSDADRLKDRKGEQWGCAVHFVSPVKQWTHIDTTIGPPGSGAAFEWPDRTVYVYLYFGISNDKPATIYVDDMDFERVPPK